MARNKRRQETHKAPGRLSFWWDFNEPGKLPIKVETNHNALQNPLATFDGPDAVERAENFVRQIEALRIHPRTRPQRIAEMVALLRAPQGGQDE